MKTVDTGLQTHLDSGETNLCWCWHLTRADGEVMGFTDHDVPLVFGGVTFEAASGFTASEVQSSLGLSVDNLTVSGAISSMSINEDDVAAGLYDNAAIEIWRVKWDDTSKRVLMRKGNLGEVKRGKTAFQAEMRGLAHVLNQPVGDVFSALCTADLGDARCTVDLETSDFKGEGTVAAAIDNRRFTATGLDDFDNDWFTRGKVTFTSGANSGRSMEVKRHGSGALGVSVELWQSMSEDVEPGDTFIIRKGCDKQFGTCRDIFENAPNYRGFPYMPGNDAVMAYPSAGDAMDGGSRYGN